MKRETAPPRERRPSLTDWSQRYHREAVMDGMTGLLDGLAHHRVAYRDAGSAMRQAVARATVADLGPLARSVLDAVLVLTVSYSKLTDTTTYRQIAELAYGREELHGRERERASVALRSLAELGILEVTPSGRGRYARVVVTVPTATLGVALEHYESMDTQSVAVDVEVVDPMATSDGANGHISATPMATPGVAHLEVLEEFRGPRFAQAKRSVSCAICEGTKNPCTKCAEELERQAVPA